MKALNDSQGNLLDDDKIITTLENLKNEAAEIMAKVEQTEVIMEEINRISALYNPIAIFCSRIYFSMEQLDQLHFLYRFSLKFFLDIFHNLLHNNVHLQNIKEPEERLTILINDLFKTIYRRVIRGLLHEDHITFALKLAQIKLKGSIDELDENEFEFLLKGGESLIGKDFNKKLQFRFLNFFFKKIYLFFSDLFTPIQEKFILELQLLDSFKDITSHIQKNKQQWKQFLFSIDAENCVPICWEKIENKSGFKVIFLKLKLLFILDLIFSSFHKLLILKAFRRDRLIVGAYNFVTSVFGTDFINLLGFFYLIFY